MHKSLEFRNKRKEATISISISDLDDTTHNDQDESVASGVAFIKKGLEVALVVTAMKDCVS